MNMEYYLGMIGMIAFSVTAVLAVSDKGIDLFGAIVMGLITATGGGTLRDVIIEVPIFWSIDQNYLWISIVASILAFYGNRWVAKKRIYQLMLYLDGVGVALFAIQAASKVYDLDFALPLGPIMLGVITAIGGGLIRDVLAGKPTLLMRRELYAVPLTLGCIFYIFLINQFPNSRGLIALACVVFTFAFRAAAIYWKLTVPNWMMLKTTE